MTNETNNIDPYVGPRPFTRREGSLFFGRDREASELLSLIIAHPVVLLYAQSGAGKTSLLNANVIPQLEKRYSQIFGTARVSGQVPLRINQTDIKNIYVFNALLSLESGSYEPASLVGLSLSEFLKKHSAPPQITGLSTRRVLIFDQFEEIFTSSPERWSDREGFFDSVGAALEEDPSLRVVFALREEYLASLDPYADFLPGRLRTRFRLERLRKEAALLAVEKPLEKTTRRFAKGAAEKLVESLLKVPIKSSTGVIIDVSEEFIEPVQLQVVCQNLWQKLPPEVTTIDEKYIENYGDVDQALSTYYDNCIAKVAEEFKIKEGEVRRWFGKHLITPDGTRGIVYRDANATGELPNKVVDRLEDLRLVRPELRGGVTWYELTHDRLIGPIRQSNQNWLIQRDKGNVTSQSLEAMAKEWHDKGRHNRDLLRGAEFRAARAWRKSSSAEEIGVSSTLKDFVKASKDRASRIRLMQLLGLAAILLVIAALFIVSAFKARWELEDAILNERGRVASAFKEQKKPFDALVWGIKAVEPNLSKGQSPPAEALKGLQDATALIGNKLLLRGLSNSPGSTGFSPDVKLALAWNRDEAAVWDRQTGKLLYKLSAASKQDGLQNWDGLYFSPDSKLLIATYRGEFYSATGKGKEPKELSFHRIWDAQSGEPLTKLQDKLKGVGIIHFSSNGKRLLAIDVDGNLRLWDVDSAEPVVALQGNVKQISLVEFLHQDEQVVIVSGNGAPVWDTRTGKQISKFPLSIKPNSPTYYTAALSHDGNFLALAHRGDEPASIWNLNDGKEVARLGDKSIDLEGMEFSSDNKTIALFENTFNNETPKIYIFDVAKGSLLSVKERPKGKIMLQPKSSSLHIIEVQSQEGTSIINVWDAFSGNMLKQVEDATRKFSDADVTPDLKYILARNEDEKDNFVYLWKIDEAPLDPTKLSPSQLLSLACSILQYQPDQYSLVKTECNSQSAK